jgi:hypothetical protein
MIHKQKRESPPLSRFCLLSYFVTGTIVPDFPGDFFQCPPIEQGHPENVLRLFHLAPLFSVPQFIAPMKRVDDTLPAMILKKLAIPVIPKGFPDLFAIHNCHLPAHCNSLTVFIIEMAMTGYDTKKAELRFKS